MATVILEAHHVAAFVLSFVVSAGCAYAGFVAGGMRS